MALFRKFDPKRQIHLVIAQMNAGDYLGALKICERVMSKAHRHPEAARLMGQIYEHLGNHRKAADCYKIALDEKPNSTNFLAYGNTCQRLGRRQEATQVFERGLTFAPSAVDIMAALAEIYEERKVWPRAVGLRKAISDRNTDDLDALYNLARCTYLANLLDEAVALSTRLLNKDPDHPDGLRLLGELMVYRRHHVRALELYDRALKVRPDDWDGHFKMAEIYLTTGDRESAVCHFQFCLRYQSAHPEAHERLIELYQEARKWLEAEVVIKHFLASCGESFRYLVELGDVCDKQDEHDEAANAYHRARKVGKADSELDAKYVAAAIHAGRAEEVLNLAQRLAFEDQLSVHYQHLYALALLAVDQRDKAVGVARATPASRAEHPEFFALREKLLNETAAPGLEGSTA